MGLINTKHIITWLCCRCSFLLHCSRCPPPLPDNARRSLSAAATGLLSLPAVIDYQRQSPPAASRRLYLIVVSASSSFPPPPRCRLPFSQLPLNAAAAIKRSDRRHSPPLLGDGAAFVNVSVRGGAYYINYWRSVPPASGTPAERRRWRGTFYGRYLCTY